MNAEFSRGTEVFDAGLLHAEQYQSELDIDATTEVQVSA